MSEKVTHRLDKLARDKIVEKHQEIGGSVDYEILKGRELLAAQVKKLQEEVAEIVDEFETTGKVGVDELSDARSLLEAINETQGRTLTELHAHQYDKQKRVGGFAAGHYIHTASVPKDSELAVYYAADPERFPGVSDD